LAEQAESEALASVNRLLQFTLVLVVITILAAALAAYLITQSITSPISKLAQAAQEISRGNLEQNVEVNQKDEIGILADSFNTMTSQLRDFINTLEQRVAQRTKALATSTEVSRRLSTILDEKQLLVEVVEQIKGAYNYYHGQIYLLDETGQTLVLAGATGEGGQALLNKGHKLSIDRGLVGRAARSKSAVLVPDTSKEPEWVANPLLPDTKAEIAIPILLGDEVLGVIDMQDNVVGDVYQEDVEFLQAIANQVAIALQNSRSYAQAQRRAEREALISSINQKIQNESTVESALQVAIREVGRALGTSARVKLKPSNGQE
jgi:nitrate/nitrite-specific signal transduction histidine kinase